MIQLPSKKQKKKEKAMEKLNLPEKQKESGPPVGKRTVEFTHMPVPLIDIDAEQELTINAKTGRLAELVPKVASII